MTESWLTSANKTLQCKRGTVTIFFQTFTQNCNAMQQQSSGKLNKPKTPLSCKHYLVILMLSLILPVKMYILPNFSARILSAWFTCAVCPVSTRKRGKVLNLSPLVPSSSPITSKKVEKSSFYRWKILQEQSSHLFLFTLCYFLMSHNDQHHTASWNSMLLVKFDVLSVEYWL